VISPLASFDPFGWTLAFQCFVVLAGRLIFNVLLFCCRFVGPYCSEWDFALFNKFVDVILRILAWVLCKIDSQNNTVDIKDS
jgi:hypothetical protein